MLLAYHEDRKLRENESQSLLMNLIALRNRLLSGLDAAEEAGDSGMVARIANQLHRNLEITGELLGDLASGGGTTINNILIQPAYIQMRVELVRVLASFPEARMAVAKVLHKIEFNAAEHARPGAS